MKKLFIIMIVVFPLSAFADLYKVTVSHKGDNLYEVFGQNAYIKTQLCLNLAIMEDAILDVQSLNSVTYGKIYFKDGDTCDVVGILK